MQNIAWEWRRALNSLIFEIENDFIINELILIGDSEGLRDILV